VEFELDDRTIHLIDTPGFDDDKRSDVRILEDIAIWMAKKGYMKEQMLDGLIFLHPVTLTRAGRSELSRTQLLEKILGQDAYSRVFITTTMWDYIVDENRVKERLDSRFAEGGVWHELKSKGAVHIQHHNTPESAHAIIRTIIDVADKTKKPEIMLENELKKEQGRLIQTSAGKSLESQIVEKIKELQGEIYRHSSVRPPTSYRNDKVSEHRTAWKRWHTHQRELEGKLARQEQELKKLQNIVVSAQHPLPPPLLGVAAPLGLYRRMLTFQFEGSFFPCLGFMVQDRLNPPVQINLTHLVNLSTGFSLNHEGLQPRHCSVM